MTFSPTYDDNKDPAICHVCGRTAEAGGLGSAPGSRDPRWLCEHCGTIGKILRSVLSDPRRMTVYEERAIETVVAGMGSMVERFGTDLGEWDEAQVKQFCSTIVKRFGPALRVEIIKGEAPF